MSNDGSQSLEIRIMVAVPILKKNGASEPFAKALATILPIGYKRKETYGALVVSATMPEDYAILAYLSLVHHDLNLSACIAEVKTHLNTASMLYENRGDVLMAGATQIIMDNLPQVPELIRKSLPEIEGSLMLELSSRS